MTSSMTHDEAREALEALALDALDAAERGAALAHVADCPECQAELVVLERTASELAYAAMPIAMSSAQRDRVRRRLIARAAADVSSTSNADVVRSTLREVDVVPIGAAPSARAAATAKRPSTGMPWMAIAASLIAIASIGSLVRVMRQRDVLRESLQTAAVEGGSRAAALDSMRGSLEDRDRVIASLTGADVAVMSLASTDPASPTARMFWDTVRGTWVLVAHHMGRPAAGRAYQLWLVTPTQKISAGMFTPSSGGDAMMRATYQLPKDSLAAIAVTEEPEAGSKQPTSAPILVASAK